MRIAVQRNRHAVDLNDFHHAAAGRDGLEEVRAACVLQRQAISIRMLVMNIDRLNPHLHPALLDNAHGVGQTIIVRFPAQQAPEQAHVGTLGVMGRRQRAMHIKLNQHLGNFAAHEVTA